MRVPIRIRDKTRELRGTSIEGTTRIERFSHKACLERNGQDELLDSARLEHGIGGSKTEEERRISRVKDCWFGLVWVVTLGDREESHKGCVPVRIPSLGGRSTDIHCDNTRGQAGSEWRNTKECVRASI